MMRPAIPKLDVEIVMQDELITLPPPPRRSIAQRAIRKVGKILRRPKQIVPELYPKVELEYWKPEAHFNAVNFGDELSRVVVELMLARKGATLSDSVANARHLVSVGSVLHLAREGSVIWGTGLHGSMPEECHHYRQLDVRATRGPITRRFLAQRGISAPEVYGDPGLLVAHLTGDRFAPTSQFEAGFVPNLHDLPFLAQNKVIEQYPGMRLINPLRAWNEVIADITRHKIILASSLHGVVIAEAFGIPACFVRLTEHEPLQKYEDYFEGTGRPLRYADNVDKGLAMAGDRTFSFDPKGLIASFPYDLWSLSLT